MAKSIIELVDDLPKNNLTVKVLKTLDSIVPGGWDNHVGFDDTISAITGVTQGSTIEKIRDRALKLYEDKKQGYQKAIWLYQTVDGTDKLVAAAALADKVGDTFRFIPFLDKLTPKADKVQSIDFSTKFMAELIAYSSMNQIGINPQKFVTSLAENYQNEALLRMAGLVCLDGLLPLGPDYITKIRSTLENDNISEIAQNSALDSIKDEIPDDDKQGVIKDTVIAAQDWLVSISSSFGSSSQAIVDRVAGFIEGADNQLDYLAAFIDASVNYFEHTGTQTVARNLINRAYEEIQ